MDAPAKRWDQYGPYTEDRSQQTLTPFDWSLQGREAVPISFGGTGRRLCLPACGGTISCVNDEGYVALGIDRDTGLFLRLTARTARDMAANLTRLADHLGSVEGGA